MATKAQYEAVTRSIIGALERGHAPWQKPWKTPRRSGYNPNLHHNAVTGHAYRGLNVWSLEAEAAARGRASTAWLTFNQARQAGGNVRKGERSTLVSFWKFDQKLITNNDTGEDEWKRTVTLRMYNVFNIEQTDGVKLPKREAQPEDSDPEIDVNEFAEAIVRGYVDNGGPTLAHDGGDSAYYRPSTDAVSMPMPGQFTSPDGWYATLFHELGHSTGHESRLDRLSKDTVLAAFGSEDYSREELVAEFTSAYLAAQSGINNTRENSTAYIAGWLRVVKSDPQAALIAAGRAQHAADLILQAGR